MIPVSPPSPGWGGGGEGACLKKGLTAIRTWGRQFSFAPIRTRIRVHPHLKQHNNNAYDKYEEYELCPIMSRSSIPVRFAVDPVANFLGFFRFDSLFPDFFVCKNGTGHKLGNKLAADTSSSGDILIVVCDEHGTAQVDA